MLLEQYAIAVVPSGQFLLEELLDAQDDVGRQGTVLAVGEVAYDAKPQEAIQRSCACWPRPAAPRPRRAANSTGNRSSALRTRLAGLTRAASTRRWSSSPVRTPARPAFWPNCPTPLAHLATHGFFADRNFRSILHAD